MKKALSAVALIAWMGFIACPITRAQATFVKHTIATIGQPMDVNVGDINGDGHPDLATVSSTNGEVAWWESNGQGSFNKRQIKTGFTGGRSIRSGDIDGDGDIDLIAASTSGNRIEWYENDGTGNFTIHLLDGNFRGAHTVQLTDLDQDGDMDILCSGWDNTAALSEVAWWENNGPEVFTKHVISSLLDQSPFVEATDIDLDGDLDMIGSDEETGEVYWWENNGSQVFTQHLIDNQFTLAHTVLARDIDKDGDPDILASACTSSLQAWYENKGSGIFEKHAMENLGGAIWLDMADFDLDGDNDMVASGMAAAQLVLYSNNGRQGFTKSLIPGGLTSGFALNIADLDQDGDPDVVAIGYSSNFLGWWENTSDRLALIQAPSWVAPGPSAGNFLVVNNDLGNIIATSGTESRCGVVNLGYCQGIALVSNLLYANSGASLNVCHPETGSRIASYRTDAQFLEGLTADPSGMLYLSAPPDGKIFRFNPVTGLIMMVAEDLDYPRALRYDPLTGEILILDGEELITVKSLDPANGNITIRQLTAIPAGGDIETDGAGNYYISSPSTNSIYVNTTGWTSPTMQYHTDLQGPWGMWYDKQARELVVAMNGANRLERIAATATGIQILREQGSTLSVYPNPFIDRINISLPDNYRQAASLKLMSPDGRIVWCERLMISGSGVNSSSVTTNIIAPGPLPVGLYYFTYSDGSLTVSMPMVHMR
jgi:hypothetical protein